MSELKYKVGDSVRIKSIDWYEKNKSKSHGTVACGDKYFDYDMREWCGKIMTILTAYQTCYIMKEDGAKNLWTDEMIECKIEEESKPEFKIGDKITNGKVTLTILTLSSNRYVVEDNFGECGTLNFNTQDDWKLVEEEMNLEDGLLDEYEELTDRAFKGGYEKCKSDIELNGFQLPKGYIFKDENGNVINATKIVLEKREYPKTYDECCDVLSISSYYKLRYYTYEHGYNEYATSNKLCSLQDKLNILGKLIICRNAYWKLYGDEMGLGKPWEPDNDNICNSIVRHSDEITKKHGWGNFNILEFPTPEMRDAFYENFKKDIEECKELL